MSTLIIHGRLGDYLWVERDGEIQSFDAVDIADMRRIVHVTGRVNRFDESDVDTLIRALVDAPELDPCTRCRELPVIGAGELCWVCADVVQALSDEVRRTLGGAA
jgi:hypothetical protein